MLDEYASRFFLLLKHAIRLDAQEKLELIQITSTPYMKQPHSKNIINHYKRLITEKREDDYDTIKKDREALLKKLKGSPV